MKQRARGGPGSGGGLEILHRDEDIIVVVKPEGLPVISAGGSRSKTLLDLVTELLRRVNPRARAAVVHRLDRDTSGVMVLACGPWAKKALMDSWAEAARDRRYHALVEGRMGAAEGRLDSWLAEAGPSRMRQARPGERGALRALGSWRLLGEGGGYSLLEVALETGRKHQIRVQLAALGHPVAGDERYGSRRDPAGRLMLHASLLELVHPRNGEILRFESPAPPAFSAALRERDGSTRPLRRDEGEAGPSERPLARGPGARSAPSGPGRPRPASGARPASPPSSRPAPKSEPEPRGAASGSGRPRPASGPRSPSRTRPSPSRRGPARRDRGRSSS